MKRREKGIEMLKKVLIIPSGLVRKPDRMLSEDRTKKGGVPPRYSETPPCVLLAASPPTKKSDAGTTRLVSVILLLGSIGAIW